MPVWELSAEHPFMEQLLGVVRPILDAVPVLLSQFGTWDADTSTLRCTGEQWRRWWAAQGRDISEVILQSGSTYVATYVRCCPADGDSARAMLIENVIEELDSSSAPCTAERIEHFAEKQRHGDLLRVHDLPTPTLSDVEASAWDSGRWELAYRIGRAAADYETHYLLRAMARACVFRPSQWRPGEARTRVCASAHDRPRSLAHRP